jgi:hypothetical protein
VPHQIVLAVEILSIDTVEIFHPPGHYAVGYLNEKVIMVVHQAVSMTDPVQPFHYRAEDPQKPYPVFIIQENIIFTITPGKDMEYGSWKFQAQWSCHKLPPFG